MDNKQARVFVSYSHADQEFVDEMVGWLEDRGDFSIWYDKHIQSGEIWNKEIQIALDEAFVVIVVMSASAKTSEYVTYEWAYAAAKGKQILPVLIESGLKVHEQLNQYQYISANPKSMFEKRKELWIDIRNRINDLWNASREQQNKATITQPIANSSTEYVQFLLDQLIKPTQQTDKAQVIKRLALKKSPEVVPYLMSYLNDLSVGAGLRCAAIESLQLMGIQTPEVISEITHCIITDEILVRKTGINYLFQTDIKNRRLVANALIEYLLKSDPIISGSSGNGWNDDNEDLKVVVVKWMGNMQTYLPLTEEQQKKLNQYRYREKSKQVSDLIDFYFPDDDIPF
jgi:hypothetical protein